MTVNGNVRLDSYIAGGLHPYIDKVTGTFLKFDNTKRVLLEIKEWWHDVQPRFVRPINYPLRVHTKDIKGGGGVKYSN